MSQEADKILEEMIDLQRKKIRRVADELGVHLTGEDILNAHDFPQLIRSSRFNFEDGYLAGLLAAQMAFRSL
ncbi:MAG: hypothetical protein HQM15_07750 [Deltaproteobacteria bacterium]|nr:hypothetical protein [Deltaproteobacteria bacterium]